MKFKKELNIRIHVLLVIIACIMTIIFTGLDDIITPFGFSLGAMRAYALASLTAVIPQVVCTIATVFLMLPILIRIFKNAHYVYKK